MATFPSIEASYGLRKNSAPKIRVVKFADGYEHRINLGLSEHQNPKEYNLAWNNITETDSDTIETFLDDRADDRASFDYTPPGESASSKFNSKNSLAVAWLSGFNMVSISFSCVSLKKLSGVLESIK